MKVLLLWVGKTDFKFVGEGVKLYSERIKRYISFEISEIKALKNAKNLSSAQIKKIEGDEILSNLQSTDYVVLLDEKGKEFTSTQFSTFMASIANQRIKRLVFVIGGAYGFSDEVYEKAREKHSLSKMTYSHQLIRVIFLEQLYRSQTIIKGEPYHHD